MIENGIIIDYDQGNTADYHPIYRMSKFYIVPEIGRKIYENVEKIEGPMLSK